MATIQLTNGRHVDEQKLLGLPEGTKFLGRDVLAAMKAVGYEVPPKATRDAMLVQVYEGKAATRFALQKELRSRLGVAEEPTPAATV